MRTQSGFVLRPTSGQFFGKSSCGFFDAYVGSMWVRCDEGVTTEGRQFRARIPILSAAPISGAGCYDQPDGLAAPLRIGPPLGLGTIRSNQVPNMHMGQSGPLFLYGIIFCSNCHAESGEDAGVLEPETGPWRQGAHRLAVCGGVFFTTLLRGCKETHFPRHLLDSQHGVCRRVRGRGRTPTARIHPPAAIPLVFPRSLDVHNMKWRKRGKGSSSPETHPPRGYSK